MSPRGSELAFVRGGSGERLLVLVHGVGASHTTWRAMLPFVETSWPGRWIAPTLRGHGESAWQAPYGAATHAADVAELIAGEPPGPVFAVGHSFGGVVASMVATGWYGVAVERLFAFSVMTRWTESEAAQYRQIGTKPPRVFTDRDAAVERALKAAGSWGHVDPRSPEAEETIEAVAGGFRTRVDPRVFGGVTVEIPRMMSSVTVPIRLGAGTLDTLATVADLRAIDSHARAFEGAGHNVHLERPDLVWKAIAAHMLG